MTVDTAAAPPTDALREMLGRAARLRVELEALQQARAQLDLLVAARELALRQLRDQFEAAQLNAAQPGVEQPSTEPPSAAQPSAASNGPAAVGPYSVTVQDLTSGPHDSPGT